MTVIAKVALILDAFTADDRGVGFAELQRRTGLAKATLHRLTAALVDARLLDRVDGRYHLSSHLFALGMRASVERGLIEVATPFLEDLYERTHETVHLGLREGAEVVRLAPRTVTSALILGRQLDEAAETGVTFEAEESAVGVVCVGAPILDEHDVAVAAVSVAGPATRFQPRKHADQVKAAAAGIAATLARRAGLSSA